ncbi:hypothetical protein, partial [Pseudomonas sp. GD03985]|uniref:hypothetical protein n=1 Tax=Pseudomonas sp. GD03985 TaxID=2975414 RepID=UPI00244B4866
PKAGRSSGDHATRRSGLGTGLNPLLGGAWTLCFPVVYWRIKQHLLFFAHKHITENTVGRKTVVQHSVIRLEFKFVLEFSQDTDFASFYKLERRLLNGQARELHNNNKLIDMTLSL